MAGISLETGEARWGGTFSNTVTAAATDLLSDGQPVEVRLIANGKEIRGPLTDVFSGFMVVANRRIPAGDVTGFYVD